MRVESSPLLPPCEPNMMYRVTNPEGTVDWFICGTQEHLSWGIMAATGNSATHKASVEVLWEPEGATVEELKAWQEAGNFGPPPMRGGIIKY